MAGAITEHAVFLNTRHQDLPKTAAPRRFATTSSRSEPEKEPGKWTARIPAHMGSARAAVPQGASISPMPPSTRKRTAQGPAAAAHSSTKRNRHDLITIEAPFAAFANSPYLSNLASLYEHMGDFAAAANEYEAVLEGERSTLDPRHADTMFTQARLANARLALGDWPCAAARP